MEKRHVITEFDDMLFLFLETFQAGRQFVKFRVFVYNSVKQGVRRFL